MTENTRNDPDLARIRRRPNEASQKNENVREAAVATKTAAPKSIGAASLAAALSGNATETGAARVTAARRVPAPAHVRGTVATGPRAATTAATESTGVRVLRPSVCGRPS